MNDYSIPQDFRIDFLENPSIQNIGDYIKALYYMESQIYEHCNNINTKVYEVVNFFERNIKNLKNEKIFDELNRVQHEGKNIQEQNVESLNDVFYKIYPIINKNVFPARNCEKNYYDKNISMKFGANFAQNLPVVNMNSLPNANNNINQYGFYNTERENFNKAINKRNYENKAAKAKFYELKEKNNKRFFQVVYMFKNKIKRMYRIDCMTRKINVNFYHYLKENYKNLEINDELLDFFKNNIRYTSKTKFQEIDKKYPNFKKIYEDYLKSDKFKKLILNIKNKYDEEYLKLFFRHSKNFLNFYLKEISSKEDEEDDEEDEKMDVEEGEIDEEIKEEAMDSEEMTENDEMVN